VYMDFMPNSLINEAAKRQEAELLKSQFEAKVDQIVERHASLPAFLVHQGEGFKFTSLLVEARELFTHGYFYSCVAMCGMATERIAKDLYVSGFTLPNTNRDKLITNLEHLNFTKIVDFLKEIGRINKETRSTMLQMGTLRDKYIHTKGPLPEFAGDGGSIQEQRNQKIKEQQEDAEKAIRYLHKVLEGTFSVFKNYMIRQGRLVPKDSTQETSE
jgi:hypothetical protein